MKRAVIYNNNSGGAKLAALVIVMTYFDGGCGRRLRRKTMFYCTSRIMSSLSIHFIKDINVMPEPRWGGAETKG